MSDSLLYAPSRIEASGHSIFDTVAHSAAWAGISRIVRTLPPSAAVVLVLLLVGAWLLHRRRRGVRR